MTEFQLQMQKRAGILTESQIRKLKEITDPEQNKKDDAEKMLKAIRTAAKNVFGHEPSIVGLDPDKGMDSMEWHFSDSDPTNIPQDSGPSLDKNNLEINEDEGDTYHIRAHGDQPSEPEIDIKGLSNQDEDEYPEWEEELPEIPGATILPKTKTKGTASTGDDEPDQLTGTTELDEMTIDLIQKPLKGKTLAWKSGSGMGIAKNAKRQTMSVTNEPSDKDKSTKQSNTATTTNEGKRICSWCKTVLGNSPETEMDTHGICPACEQRYFPDDNQETPETPPVEVQKDKDINEGETVCAWCKTSMGSFAGTGVSHGICQPCKSSWMKDVDKKKSTDTQHDTQAMTRQFSKTPETDPETADDKVAAKAEKELHEAGPVKDTAIKKPLEFGKPTYSPVKKPIEKFMGRYDPIENPLDVKYTDKVKENPLRLKRKTPPKS